MTVLRVAAVLMPIVMIELRRVELQRAALMMFSVQASRCGMLMRRAAGRLDDGRHALEGQRCHQQAKQKCPESVHRGESSTRVRTLFQQSP